MASYRLYCPDGHRKITAAEGIEAEEDTAALAARALGKPMPCELWLRNRMIERIEPPSS